MDHNATRDKPPEGSKPSLTHTESPRPGVSSSRNRTKPVISRGKFTRLTILDAWLAVSAIAAVGMLLGLGAWAIWGWEPYALNGLVR